MFIAIEGPEGSGKSTIGERLADMYKKRGLSVVFSREPGGTPAGEAFRRVLRDPAFQGQFPPLSEFFGLLAARAAFVEGIIRPALQRGDIVITDRYSLSTMAYQIIGRGLPESECMAAVKLAEGGITPYYVVLMVSPEVGLQRKSRQGDASDRFAKEDLEYHQRVADGYRKYAEITHGHLVDTDQINQEEVFCLVRARLEQMF